MLIKTIELWETRSDVTLTTFIALPDEFIPNPVKRPAMIVCPGGAYQMCPRHGNEGDQVAMTYAADGYQAFVLEYSVARYATKEQTLFPAQLLDLAKAILTIRENADEWQVDVERISLIGFSAGGHLCGMYATTWHKALFSNHFNMPKEVFKPLSAILIYPVADYIIQEKMRENDSKQILGPGINVPVFGAEEPTQEQLIEYSPSKQVSDQTVPIFIAAAIDDGMVTALNSLELARELQKHKRPYELHMFEYGDHGFSLGRHLLEPFRHDMAHACAKWVEMSKIFLMHQIASETTVNERSLFGEIEFG